MKKTSSILIASGLIFLFLIFRPVLEDEIRYQFASSIKPLRSNKNQKQEIRPVSQEFSLIIPKIGLNVQVFPNVDPQNPSEFLPVLKKGAAHAKGSAYPDENEGNVFLFAHSTDRFYSITYYNALFYLIGKLEKGDRITVFYKQKKYDYKVIDRAIVAPEKVLSYVEKFSSRKTLTLQTCYPPGTTLKRLLVIAEYEGVPAL